MRNLADYMTAKATLPKDAAAGAIAGRVWLPDAEGPAVVAVRADGVHDISKLAPTMRDLAEGPNPAALVRDGKGQRIGALDDILANTPPEQRNARKPWLLAPIDLQAIKAAGVTFPLSMLERVIEEQARGAPEKAEAIRASIATPARRRSRQARARQQAGGRAQARADRAGRLVAIPGGRHRPGRGDLHQGAAHVRRRPRHGGGAASDLQLEQPGAGGGAGGERDGRHRRRDARQRRQPARRRGPLRAAARPRPRTTTPPPRSGPSSASSMGSSRSTRCARSRSA